MKTKVITLSLIAAVAGFAMVAQDASAQPSSRTIGAVYSQKYQEKKAERTESQVERAAPKKTVALAVGQNNQAPPPGYLRKQGGRVRTFSFSR